MWTLIQRELRDHSGYVLAAAVLATLMSMFGVIDHFGHLDNDFLAAMTFPLLILFCTAAAGLGFVQMRADPKHGVSGFLCTLPVSREAMLFARIVGGLLIICVGVIPVWVVWSFAPPRMIQNLPFAYEVWLRSVGWAFFLLAVGCYSLGLQAHGSRSKQIFGLGIVMVSLLFLSVLAIKGPTWGLSVLLFVFIAANLTRTWLIFRTAQL